MTVNPGFGGQTYLAASNDKIRRARELLTTSGSRAFLEGDGGITSHTIGAAHAAGADTFVVGNAGFPSPDPARGVRERKQLFPGSGLPTPGAGRSRAGAPLPPCAGRVWR